MKNKKRLIFIAGVAIIAGSTILNLVILPLLINRRISDLGYLRKDIEMEIDSLQSSLEKTEKLKFQSLILRTELDILMLSSVDSSEVLAERQTEFEELEGATLLELAKNVLSDSELLQQEKNWIGMDYNQLQAEQEFYAEKIHDLILGYHQQMIANEQELTNELNYKEIVLYAYPSILIIGTIVTNYSQYLRIEEERHKETSD